MILANNPYFLVKLLITRVLMISLYLACYKNITKLTFHIASMVNSPFLLFTLIFNTGIYKYLKSPKIRTFTVIMMLFTAFSPVFRTLLCDIDTDTTFLCFSICQVIFCIDSVGTSLMTSKDLENIKNFKRNEIITLEEGLLIPLKKEDNGILVNISFLIGCFCTFSRLQRNIEVLILLGFGFIFYILVPFYIDQYTNFIDGFIVLISSIIYLADKEGFFLFGKIILLIAVFMALSIQLIKAINPIK